MIKVLANRTPVPAADGCRILCNLSVAAGILVTHTVDICAMRANSQSQAFEAKLLPPEKVAAWEWAGSLGGAVSNG
jgi:hypothetical protein